MPSSSPRQARTMRAAAHNPAFAKKVGIPTSVAKEFVRADQKTGKYAHGGRVAEQASGKYAHGGYIKGRNLAAEAIEKTTRLSAHPGSAAVQKVVKSLSKKTGINLSEHKLIEETKQHFHIKGPTGSFKVAKSGLSIPTIQKLKTHFAQGGYAEGGPFPTGKISREVAANYVEEGLKQGKLKLEGTLTKDKLIDAVANGDLREFAGTGVLNPQAGNAAPAEGEEPAPGVGMGEVQAAPSANVNPYYRQWLESMQNQTPFLDQSPIGGSPADLPAQEIGGATPNELATQMGNPPPEGVAPSATPESSPGGQSGATGTGPPGASGPPPLLARPPEVPGAGLPSIPDVSGSMAQHEDEALRQRGIQATEVQKQQDEMAKIAGDAATALKQGTDKALADYTQTTQAAKDLAQKIANFEVKPNALFTRMDTPHKIMTAIGLIVGGIGAGLSRGPNLASEFIDKAIENDINAQKANLGKMQSQYAMYIEQGRTALQAAGLVRATQMDITSLLMQQAAAKYQGTIAQANILAGAQEFAMKADKERQQVAFTGIQGELLKFQMARARWELQMMQGALPRPGGAGNAAGSTAQFIAPKPLTLNAQNELQAVPETRIFNATNEKTQEAAQKYMEDFANARHDVMYLNALVQKYPHGALPQTEARGMIDALTGITQLSWMRAGEGVNRLNRQELETIEKNIIPDLKKLKVLNGYELGTIKTVLGKVNSVHEQKFRTYFGGVNADPLPEGYPQMMGMMGMKVYPVSWTELVPAQGMR